MLSSNNDPLNSGDMHEGFELGWEELAPRADDEKRAREATAPPAGSPAERGRDGDMATAVVC